MATCWKCGSHRIRSGWHQATHETYYNCSDCLAITNEDGSKESDDSDD